MGGVMWSKVWRGRIVKDLKGEGKKPPPNLVGKGHPVEGFK